MIKPSQSPWSSPVVLVKKRDGTILFCVDSCLLNSITKPDVFPLPRISDLLDQWQVFYNIRSHGWFLANYGS